MSGGNGTPRPATSRFVLAVFLGCIVGTFSFLAVLAMWLGKPATSVAWAGRYLFAPNSSSQLSPNEKFWIEYLLQNGHILPPEGIYNSTVSFYDTVIVILVTIIGVLGVVAYMYIRGASLAYAEERAEVSAQKNVDIVFKSQAFRAQVREQIESSVEGDLRDIFANAQSIDERFEKIDVQLAELSKKTNEVETFIAERDTSENASNEEEILEEGAEGGRS